MYNLEEVTCRIHSDAFAEMMMQTCLIRKGRWEGMRELAAPVTPNIYEPTSCTNPFTESPAQAHKQTLKHNHRVRNTLKDTSSNMGVVNLLAHCLIAAYFLTHMQTLLSHSFHYIVCFVWSCCNWLYSYT